MLVFRAGSRPATAALARTPNSRLNPCTDVHPRPQPRASKARWSVSETHAGNPLNRSASAPTPHPRRPIPHSAPRTANVPLSRFPPLEVFGRRPQERAARFVSGRHPKTLYGAIIVKLDLSSLLPSPCSAQVAAISSSRPDFDGPPRAVTVKGGRRPSRSDLPLTVTSTAAG
jgi:hypothetical protein